jgi:hypothetical protein
MILLYSNENFAGLRLVLAMEEIVRFGGAFDFVPKSFTVISRLSLFSFSRSFSISATGLVFPFTMPE